MAAVTELKRISRERLSALLLSGPKEGSLVIVDVRDHDHVGGHIKSSRHVPSSTLDYAAPELVRQLQHAEQVVFHCALSQQRGPTAALKYLRERGRLLGAQSASNTSAKKPKENVEEPKELQTGEGSLAVHQEKQEVYVLDGGFVKWQEKYGDDERLTEDYAKDLWMAGYLG